MQYTDNPEFNDYIDKNYGEVIIGDFCCPASIVLFEMDEIEYVNLYNQYLSEQKESLLERVTSVFPTPIAFYYDRALHGYDNNNQRLQILRSTWEATIFFLYALVIGEVINSSLSINQIKIKAFNNQIIKCNKNGLLSDKLGYKLEVIKEIIDFNLQENCGLMVGDLIPYSVIDYLDELNDSRNSISHISALSENQSEKFFEKLHPKIKNIFFELRKLEQLSLLRYKSSKSPITSIVFSKFKGCSLVGRNYEKNMDQSFITKNSENLRNEYLFCEFEEHDQIICLSPFACIIPLNGKHHIAWYKKLDSENDMYYFEILSDWPEEFGIPTNIFNKPIENLKALL